MAVHFNTIQFLLEYVLDDDRPRRVEVFERTSTAFGTSHPRIAVEFCSFKQFLLIYLLQTDNVSVPRSLGDELLRF